MSGFEMKPVDEAQFDAFLQGRDELSQLLRLLPQPKPDANLDAAIFATISAQMPEQESLSETGLTGLDSAKISVLPTNSAANESNLAKTGLGFGFFQRWAMPFGLAAGAMLVTSLLLMRFDKENQSTEVLAKAEIAAPAANKIVIAQADSVRAMPADSSGKGKAAPMLEEKPSIAAAPEEAASSAKLLSDKINNRLPVRQAEETLAMRDDMRKKSLSALPAKPVAEELARAESTVASETKSTAPTAEQFAFAHERARAAQEKLQIEDARRQAEAVAQKAGRASGFAENRAGEPQNGLHAADTELAAAVVAQPDQATRARRMAKRPELASEARADSLVAAAPVVVAPAPTPVEVAAGAVKDESNPAQRAQAKSWLSLIEELLKAEMQQEALDEWLKFRKAYPYYPVKAVLQEKMQAMQKAKGK